MVDERFHKHQNAMAEELHGMSTEILQYIDDIMSVPLPFILGECFRVYCVCVIRMKK